MRHFDSPELPQFITFRLSDSLPREIVFARLGESRGAYRRRLERALDAGAGACWLARPEFAAIVADAVFYDCGRSHELHAFVVMPNHVHVLTTFAQGARLADCVRNWKSFSARRINESLGRRGAFWQREYFDRFVRDPDQFERVRDYIEYNPVRAGLASSASAWLFSSAAPEGRLPSRP